MFDGFWDNVSRYPRYLVTIILGVFFYAFAWLQPLMKNPISAIATIGLFVAGLTFVALTLRAMLGLGPV
ncbi:DUF751 family protein [Funiculus sociatus GB2-A5]|jgi:hypothetical protein|uniref:DUF751 family protein n=1 Tax=Funiculus sociatus GB2-A5 TaxID=2933946 RepID=A0ABV0JIN6_9CYAN|nr:MULTISPECIES: DUF751 family protein [unclassified Trichocoleus]MBD1904638.1 DUF751 family protein [Trichocoleus sp. FACHB-832]MBD2062437.1 DUF751 family protein [Trichocoleus sp. FACHB-6]